VFDNYWENKTDEDINKELETLYHSSIFSLGTSYLHKLETAYIDDIIQCIESKRCLTKAKVRISFKYNDMWNGGIVLKVPDLFITKKQILERKNKLIEQTPYWQNVINEAQRRKML
jgi:hypothetical protein